MGWRGAAVVKCLLRGSDDLLLYPQNPHKKLGQ